MADIIISGYHGFSNSGDDALLRSVIDSLRAEKEDVSITVLSGNPAETERLYKIRSIHRYNYFKIIKEMRGSKLLIFGGGSLLQDVTSSKSLYYYLSILKMAQRRNMHTMLFANGIGPLNCPGNRKRAAKVLNKVNVITLRDDTSDQELKSMKVEGPNIQITADPVFALDLSDFVPDKKVVTYCGLDEKTPYMVVSVRPWKYADKNFFKILASSLDDIAEQYGVVPVFMPMQASVDIEAAETVSGLMQNKHAILRKPLSLSDALSLISGAEITVGMRLHTLIYATVLNVPSMALVYDPKVSAFMQSVNQPLCVNVENITLEETKEKLASLLEERMERKKDLIETNRVLQEKAKENARFAIDLLK